MTGDELRVALAELGWKQSDLCRRVNMGKNTVSGWAANGPPDWVAEFLGTLLALDRVHREFVRPVRLAAGAAPAPVAEAKQKRLRRAANLAKKLKDAPDMFADVSSAPAGDGGAKS